MKNFLSFIVLYLGLAMLLVSCTDRDEVIPACVQAEVIGPDCSGEPWYVLRVIAKETTGTGIAEGDFYPQNAEIRVNNLPEHLRQPGKLVYVTLEEVEAKGAFCLGIYSIPQYAATVKNICSSDSQ